MSKEGQEYRTGKDLPTYKAEPASVSYRLFPSCRFVVYLLLTFGFACTSGGMNNIGFAITCMTNQSSSSVNTETLPDRCLWRLNETEREEDESREFAWSTEMQGFVLSGSAWGSSAITLLSWIPDKFGAKWFLFTGMSVNGIANILTPTATKDVRALILVRILQGLGSGVTWGALAHVTALWSPKREFGTTTAIATAGLNVGSVFNYMTAGKMCDSIGWRPIFYMWGGLCLLWSVTWFFLYSDNINETRLPISEKERIYISLGKNRKLKGPIPFRQIFTSPYVWVLGYTSLMGNQYVYFVNDFLPTYMKTVLLLPSNITGIFTAIAPLCQFFARLISGSISDRLTFISITTNVKLFTFICSLFPAILLLAASTFDCTNVVGAVACISAGFFFLAFCPAGYLKSIVFLAPSYASTIGMFNAFMTSFSGVLIPFILPQIMPDYTLEQWRHSMYYVAACMTSSTVLYLSIGTAKTQPWGVESGDEKESKEMKDIDDFERF